MVGVFDEDFRKSWRERRKALANLPPVMKMVWKSGPSVAAAGIALRVVSALIPVAMLNITKLIIDGVNASTGGKGLPHGFWWLMGAEFGLAVVLGILTQGVAYFDTLFGERFTRYVSLRVMEHASRLDLASYENPEFQDKLERARMQASDRVGMIRELGRMLQLGITAIGMALSILAFSPWLMLVLVGSLIPAFLGESHFAFLGYSLNFTLTPVRRLMDYYRMLGASRETAKEMKLYNLSPFFVRKFRGFADQVYEENRSLAGRRLWASVALSVVTATGYYGAYAWVVYCAVSGRLTIGTMMMLAGAIAATSTNVQTMFVTFSGIADQALFLTDLYDFLKLRPHIRNSPRAIPLPKKILQGFEFRDVGFKYPDRDSFVVQHLNLCWKPGERLALIGANGQGKTTIVKLLTRLYDPTEGQILLNGVDLREYDLKDLSRNMAAIMQDFVRYEMSAAENISMGCIDASPDQARMKQAAKKSLADKVVSKLPQGYAQQLGRRFNGGVDLSGGEWQRIALARAYMRDAQMLILDEPTAALDAKAEHEVFEKFNELTEGKMALFISHRFSTVKMADRIVVLENGAIAEEGNHVGLMQLGRRYFEMFEMQAASYR